MGIQLFIDLYPISVPSDRARVIFKERVNAVAYIKADNKVCCILAMSGLSRTAPQLSCQHSASQGTITPYEFQVSSKMREGGSHCPSGSSGASS